MRARLTAALVSPIVERKVAQDVHLHLALVDLHGFALVPGIESDQNRPCFTDQSIGLVNEIKIAL